MNNNVKILLRGPFLSQSGYGEDARFLFRSLRYKEGVELFLVPTGWGMTGWLWEDSEERREIDQLINKTTLYIRQFVQQRRSPVFDLSVQVTIPPEWEKLAPVNIGVTAGVETHKVPLAWFPKCVLMDKIIVHSEFTKQGFLTEQAIHDQQGVLRYVSCKIPVEVVPYPVRVFDSSEFDLALDYEFNFLSVAQWSPRKNIEQTILGFLQEFYHDEVGLILKLTLKNESIIDNEFTIQKLQMFLKNVEKDFPDKKCKIYLLHGHLSDHEMAALYKHPKIKAIVSTAHGEGTGLPLLEAASHGLPIVAPYWSGYCDFVTVEDKENKKKRALIAKVDYTLQHVQKEAVWKGVIEPDAMWCFPSMGSYRDMLRQVQKNYGMYKSRAEQLREHVLTEYTSDACYQKFAQVVLSTPEESRKRALEQMQTDLVGDMLTEQQVALFSAEQPKEPSGATWR
jgi:glycosyltransferase involved in cell wall biosynthesis